MQGCSLRLVKHVGEGITAIGQRLDAASHRLLIHVMSLPTKEKVLWIQQANIIMLQLKIVKGELYSQGRMYYCDDLLKNLLS